MQKTLWITRTAVMAALLVALQWVTKPLGQLVTGSCVNLVLGTAALAGGLWCGVTVAAISPFFAFLVGVGPVLFPVVPLISVGNAVLVLILWALCHERKLSAVSFGAVALAAAGKFLTLWLLAVKLAIPALQLSEAASAAISLSFSWPQLVTAAIGGTLAVTLAPMIRKAINK